MAAWRRLTAVAAIACAAVDAQAWENAPELGLSTTLGRQLSNVTVGGLQGAFPLGDTWAAAAELHLVNVPPSLDFGRRLRTVFRVHSRWNTEFFRADVGFSVFPAQRWHDSDAGARLMASFRIGSERFMVAAGTGEGGPGGAVLDSNWLGIGGGPALAGIDVLVLPYVATRQDWPFAGPVFGACIEWKLSNFAFTFVPEWHEGEVDLFAFAMRWHGPAEKRSQAVAAAPFAAPEPAAPEGPAYTDLLRPGTRLRYRHEPGAVVQNCTVDAQLDHAGHSWRHLTCDRDAPESAAVRLATACYEHDAWGFWRLPRCPGEPIGPQRKPWLVFLAPQPPRSSARFYDIVDSATRSGRAVIDGKTVLTRCQTLTTAAVAWESCVTPDHGALFAQSYVLPRPAVGRHPPQPAQLLGASHLVAIARGKAPPDTGLLHAPRNGSETCEFSSDCWAFGQCSAVADDCVAAADADCAASVTCERLGHCHAKAGVCAATEDADCRRAPKCGSDGLCRLRGGRCVAQEPADCADSVGCRLEARCTPRLGHCMRASSSDCRAHEGCKQDGLCTLQGGACEAVSDDDCTLSEGCVRDGRCRAEAGACAASKP